MYGKKEQIAQVMLGYEARKKARRYLDYDDILDVVAQRLASFTETCSWVASQYDHFLVDEMQDTNPLQWKLLNPLRGQVTLFCVGDDAQSIYGFRGADFRNVHSFTERVEGSVTLKLEQNYRSTQQILNASNWLLSGSYLNYGKDLTAARGAGKCPQLHTFSNEWEEGRWIADDLVERRSSGTAWRNHMILVRSSFSARVIESALLAKEIPYRFIGGTKLLESAHVRDVISALRIVANPQDEIGWMRFLTLWNGVGEVTANKVIESILPLQTIDDCIKTIEGTAKIPREALAAIQIVKELQNNVSQAVANAVKAMEDVLAAKYRTMEWEKRRNDFRLVEKLAAKHTSILAFIEEYLLEPVYGSLVEHLETTDIVTMITIHSAKGTESEVCYVVNVSPGAYPSQYAIGNDEDVEEERRVLYVALTRAKDELILTRHGYRLWAVHRDASQDSSEDKNVASYFLNSFPEGIFEEHLHEREAWDLGVKAPQNEQSVSVGISIGFEVHPNTAKSCTLFFVDNLDGTATDTRTGLMWMRPALGQVWNGVTSVGNPQAVSWDEAVQMHHQFAGYDDWRIPDLTELQTIVSFVRSNPAINSEVFPNTPSELFLTTSTMRNYPENRYKLNFADGSEGLGKFTHRFFLRLVRGSRVDGIAQQNFVDNGNGTVTDRRSGLMWMRCSLGQFWDGTACVGKANLYNWESAMEIRHQFAGFDDWRLPDADELSSLINPLALGTITGLEAFPNTSFNSFWSATKCGPHPIVVCMGDRAFPTNKCSELSVRLVRSGSILRMQS